MAATSATSYFDARRERGLYERKIPRLKIGLDDCKQGGIKADYMLWPATRRCDGFCMERAPRCELPMRTLTLSSWVGLKSLFPGLTFLVRCMIRAGIAGLLCLASLNLALHGDLTFVADL